MKLTRMPEDTPHSNLRDNEYVVTSDGDVFICFCSISKTIGLMPLWEFREVYGEPEDVGNV